MNICVRQRDRQTGRQTSSKMWNPQSLSTRSKAVPQLSPSILEEEKPKEKLQQQHSQTSLLRWLRTQKKKEEREFLETGIITYPPLLHPCSNHPLRSLPPPPPFLPPLTPSHLTHTTRKGFQINRPNPLRRLGEIE